MLIKQAGQLFMFFMVLYGHDVKSPKFLMKVLTQKNFLRHAINYNDT